ncbi:flavoprotein [Ascoidea rubescens DSM 1968]|uniref:Flavo protein n=1 Tax=Ascoidea rubescens DSM 1968 TaxID=1344418 RepID=A0A1D2VQE6_9ASCO|nr:flavo protein [Ascoidea rubescens DSM 1968]ODV63787.1 flavo protein [Ascoidea rubescens DSM 1968]
MGSMQLVVPSDSASTSEAIRSQRDVSNFWNFEDGKIHILICATGSVASIKIPLMVQKLYDYYNSDESNPQVSIQLILTKASESFLNDQEFKIPSDIKIWREVDNLYLIKNTKTLLDLQLVKWAHICLIAPISANTLAKISNGLSDNLLTTVIRSWNPKKPMVIAPAMNTFMYLHPITKLQLDFISNNLDWIEVLYPIQKTLICGDVGVGAMREWSEIIDILILKIENLDN